MTSYVCRTSTRVLKDQSCQGGDIIICTVDRRDIIPHPCSSLKALLFESDSSSVSSYNDSLNRLKKWRSYKRWNAVCRSTPTNIGRRSGDAFFPKVARSSGRSISPVNLLLSFLLPENLPLFLHLFFASPARSLWLHSCSRNSFCLRVPEDHGPPGPLTVSWSDCQSLN